MDGVVKEGSIGSVLFRSRIINETDIEKALAEQKSSGCRFGEALVKLGIVTQEDIDWALSNQLNIPYVRLKKEMMDREAVALVPAEMARRYTLVPLIRAGDELSIAIADPLNGAAIEAVERVTGCRISVSVGLVREIREMLDYLYGPPVATESLGFSSDSFSFEAIEAINGDLSGGKLLDHLLFLISRRNYSSLSLQPTGEDIRVTVRSGEMTKEIARLGNSRYVDIAQRIRKMSGIGSSSDVTARGKLGFRIKNQALQFQVLLLRTMAGDYITFCPERSSVFPESLSDFCLDACQEADFRSLLASRTGLVLFVMRDPLERSRFLDFFLDQYDTSGKTVILVGEGLGRGRKRFPRLALHDWPPHDASSQVRAVLDHNPDVVAIEEMGDSHSFMAAGRAALRGKLVVAGVPWQGSGEAMRHLFSLRHRNSFIVNMIKGIVVCTSVMTLCERCRVEFEPEQEERALMPSGDDLRFYRSAGCDECGQTGFAGKRYLLEVVPFDRKLNDAFASAHDTGVLLQYLRERGIVSVRQRGDELLVAGGISPQEYISSFVF